METNQKLEEIKNEVERKIGRNIILFQKIELMVKFLLASKSFSGYVSELEIKQEQRQATISKYTMGQLITLFSKSTFLNSDLNSEGRTDKLEELKQIYISFNFKIESDDSASYKAKIETLHRIVYERNQLVHHFLPKWNFISVEGGKATEQYLDQQHEKILPEFEYFENLTNTMRESIKLHIEFLASDEFEKFVNLLPLRTSLLVAWLLNIADKEARADGWIELSKAVHIICQNAPEEIADLRKKYKYKNLKNVILATELFDISEELTDKGGIRVLYRIKPDLQN